MTLRGEPSSAARSGGGPTLLECRTYRLCGHSRSDPRTYRTQAEEEEWAGRDPIKRMGEHLLAQGLATQSMLDQVEKDVTAAVDDAVAFADASPAPEPEEALQHVFWDEAAL